MTDDPTPPAPGAQHARWSDAHLDYHRFVGDVEADAAVAVILRDPALTAPQFFRWLVRNDSPVPADVPPPIAHYFQDTALPAFAREDLIRDGQRVFTKWGPQICMALFCASLPVGYSADRIVRILHSTGRLETDALRRVFETAQMLFNALDQGGLGPEGRGIRSSQRVRLMHAGVRHLIAAADADLADQARIDGRPHAPLWPLEWGKPINQEDLAGTLLTFTIVVFDALEKLGVRLTADERAAYMHTWRVIGHFMGIMDDMLPRDEADGRRLWA
ncbi:MAG: oxygenase MpaB family protein, partial [Tepidiformaceae bacterium]